MKSRNAGWMGLVLVVLGGVACTPSPEKVCAKLAEIDKEGWGNPIATAACKPALEALKSADSGKYKTMAKCVMDATDAKGAEKCMEAMGK